MSTTEDIKRAIEGLDRTDKIYVHPILSEENAARNISALANGNGGDIIIGIYDNGVDLIIKKSKFVIPLEEAKLFLNKDVKCTIRYVEIKGTTLPYISVKKSEDLITSGGVPYILNENGVVARMKINKVFISYSHKDSDLADLVEGSLEKEKDICVSRDININDYRDDLTEFMKTIRKHDFTVSIVTNEYLMSLNSMYEITELKKDSDFEQKLLFIVVNNNDAQFYKGNNVYDMDAKIYDANKRFSYIGYWNHKNQEMDINIENARQAGVPYEHMTEYTRDKRKLVSIIPSTSEFMSFLSEKIGMTFNEIQKDDFKILKDEIRNNS